MTDKRTGLEIRVTKERLQSVDGTFKWISSGRQYADGLTKEATRQLLADRSSYGKTKFTCDPLYTAAKKKKKKKKLSQRNQSRDEFTSPNLNSNATSTFNPTSINNNGEKRKKPMFDEKIDEETCDADLAMNYQEPEQCSYFADGDDKFEYVNLVKPQDVPVNDLNSVEYEISKNVIRSRFRMSSSLCMPRS